MSLPSREGLRVTRWLVVAAVGAALVGAGCRCGRESELAPVPAEEATAVEDRSAIPRATRAHPTLTPALTLTVTADAFELTNDELLATWPPVDRARARAAAPFGDEEWPGVRVRVEERAGSSYRVEALARAFLRAAAIDRARAGSARVPVAYSLRVGADVPWQRVIEALYTAGQSGWGEPRFVLRAEDGDGEIYLSIPIPRSGAPDEETAARARAAFAEAVRTLGTPEEPAPDRPGLGSGLASDRPRLGSDRPRLGSAGSDEPDRPRLGSAGSDEPERSVSSAAAPLVLRLTESRTMRASIGAQPLAPGCGSIHETALDVVPSLDAAAVAACIESARGAGPAVRGARLAVAGVLPFGEVLPILEALRASEDDVWIVVGD